MIESSYSDNFLQFDKDNWGSLRMRILIVTVLVLMYHLIIIMGEIIGFDKMADKACYNLSCNKK